MSLWDCAKGGDGDDIEFHGIATREARAVAALSHPHIVTIHSIEEAGGIRFITMELIEGQTLDRVIPAGGGTWTVFGSARERSDRARRTEQAAQRERVKL